MQAEPITTKGQHAVNKHTVKHTDDTKVMAGRVRTCGAHLAPMGPPPQAYAPQDTAASDPMLFLHAHTLDIHASADHKRRPQTCLLQYSHHSIATGTHTQRSETRLTGSRKCNKTLHQCVTSHTWQRGGWVVVGPEACSP
jgi:hypothetical protein